MPNTYVNALSYLDHMAAIEAERAAYIDTVLRYSSMAQMVPIVPTSHFMEDHFYEKERPATSNVQKRKLNQDVDAKHTGNYIAKREPTFLYKTKTQMDYKLVNKDPEELDRRMATDMGAMMEVLDYDIINSVETDDGDSFNGLKQRLTGDFLLTPTGAGGFTVNSSATTMKTFVSIIREALSELKLGPGAQPVIFVNKHIDLAIQNGRDAIGADAVGTGTVDIFNQRVTMLDGVPLVKLGADDIGRKILPFSEPDDTCSIYVCAIGGAPAEGSKEKPNGMVLLSSSDGVMDEHVERIGVQIYGHQEAEFGLRVPKRSAIRINNLKAASYLS